MDRFQESSHCMKLRHLFFSLLILILYPFMIFSHNPGITVQGTDYIPFQEDHNHTKKNSYHLGGSCKKNTIQLSAIHKIEGKVLSCPIKGSDNLLGFYFSNGLIHHVDYYGSLYKEILHITDDPYLVILGKCYNLNDGSINWVSNKKKGSKQVFSESILDLQSLILTMKEKNPDNTGTSKLKKFNCYMFNNLEQYREHIERQMQRE